jgi:hypothetical protein
VNTRSNITKSKGRPLARRPKAGQMRQSIIATKVIFIACVLTASYVQAQQTSQNVRVFGANVPARGGAFVPAGTDLACMAVDAGRCRDGKKWHALYPTGPRKYSVPTSDEVACVVIVESDCWTGSAWYRLPSGQIFGRTPGGLGWAFVTAPLRP